MAAHLQSRTLWAERQVEEFLSLPLVSEFVFRSPQTVDGSQREVADFLVTCDAPGILISQKCQEDPTVRTARKRSEEHTSELQSRLHLVCRLLLEKKKYPQAITPVNNT